MMTRAASRYSVRSNSNVDKSLLLPVLISIPLGVIALTVGAVTTEQIEVPLSARYSISMAIGNDQDVYHARTENGAYVMRNPRQQLRAVFTREGTLLERHEMAWQIGLQAWGYQGSLMFVRECDPEVRANRVEYQHAGLSEWYINGPLGLQQGFTLHRAPQAGSGKLLLQMGLPEHVKVLLSDDSTGFVLLDEDMTPLLTYNGLLVWDATGSTLQSSIAVLPCEQTGVSEHAIRIVVDDSAATYPITIDPWVESAKLTASDQAYFDQLGWAVAIDGDTVVIGAHLDGEGASGNRDMGSAYVFVEPVTGWATTSTFAAKLTASDWAVDDELGTSVAIDGDTIVVGAVGDSSNQGSVYIFERPAGGWSGNINEVAKLTSSPTYADADDSFGFAVDIDGGTVVVGAPSDQIPLDWTNGLAYVFEEPASGWDGCGTPPCSYTEDAVLDPAYIGIGPDDAEFGTAVAISGSTVVVGAPGVDLNGSYSGLIYVFEQPLTGWAGVRTETAYLYPEDPWSAGGVNVFVYLGHSVDIDGDTIVAGAYGDSNNPSPQRGEAYVFEEGAGWGTGAGNLVAELNASDIAMDDQFGCAVSIDGEVIVVGSKWDDDNGESQSGSVYIFEEPAGGWADMTQTDKVTASDATANDYLGHAVAVSGDVTVAGAPFNGISYGAAYVFERLPEPEIDVQRPAGTSIAYSGTDASGSHASGPTSLTYTVENLGSATLNVSNITSAGAINVNVGAISPTSFAVPVGGTATFNVPFTPPAGDGPFSFDLLLTNDDTNEGSFPFTVVGTWDGTAPDVTINQAIAQADPTNVSPVVFTVVFDEPIDDSTFTDVDVDLSGSTATTGAVTVTEAAPMDDTTFRVSVVVTADGDVVATIPAGGIEDLAGNTNTISTWSDNTVTFDTTRPDVTINQASTQADPTNVSPVVFTVVFDEPINETTFTNAEVNLNSSTATTGAVSVTEAGPMDDTTFEVSVAVTADGDVIATIPAGAVEDPVGNTNTISTSSDNTVTFDTTIDAPGVPDLTAASDTGASDTDDRTDDTTPQLTGTCETGATVTLTSSVIGDLTPTGTCTGGIYDITVSNVLSEGTHDISASQVDAIGNSSPQSGALGVQIIIPTLTVIVAGNAGTDNVASTTGSPNPSAIDCPGGSVCAASFGLDDNVSLNVTVDATSAFIGWSGDCAALGSALSGAITMSSDRSCTATFGSPEIDVEGNGTSILNGDTTPGAGDGTDFGDASQESSLDRTFFIQNEGGDTLTLTDYPNAVTLTGHADFIVQTQPTSGAIAVGGSDLTFVVCCTPSGTGDRSTRVSIANNDPDENPYSFDLACTGVSPEIDIQRLVGVTIADGSIDDTGDQVQGTVNLTYTVDNTAGSAQLSITNVTSDNLLNVSDFNLLSTMPLILAAGEVGSFDVSFVVDAQGAFNLDLEIDNNDLDESPYLFSIQGSGMAQPIAVPTSGPPSAAILVLLLVLIAAVMLRRIPTG